MTTGAFPLAGVLVAAALLHHAPGQGAPVQGQATVVIRHGIAVRAEQHQVVTKHPDGSNAPNSSRTVIRPCDSAEPVKLCRLVLVEVQ